ncbi:MAG: hypothetical protein ACHQM4_04670 [Thermoanaerobaculia bacterium]
MRTKQKRPRKTYRSLAELPKVYVPLEDAKSTLADDAAWFGKHLGPDVPRITRRGRPPKGVKVEPGRVRSLRIPDSTWRALQRQAKASGLSTNTAVRLAVLSWTENSADRR